MTHLLIRPDNRQPAAFVATSRGRICLDTTCITPAVRWWTIGQLEVVNDRAAIAQACKTPEAYRPAWEVNPYALVVWEAPKPLVVTMPADLMVHIREAVYCSVKAA